MSYNATETPAGRRIAALLDEGSFAEIGGEVTARSTDFNLQEKKTPSDGVITGYGLIDGNLVYVYSQDPDVLNGSMGEMHAKKIGNIYDMAIKMGAPVIGLIDCAGFRFRKSVSEADQCVRCCSPDYCYFRHVRRRTGSGARTGRFYVYGEKYWKNVYQFPKYVRREFRIRPGYCQRGLSEQRIRTD